MATLTAKDRDQEYNSETLSKTLEANESCRHTARIAHLYINRTAYLTDKDYQEDLPQLFDRIFGVLEAQSGRHADHGWLERIKNVADAPRLLAPLLRSNLEATFNDKKWSRDQLAAFRVFQLLDPGDRGNLFELIFERDNRQCIKYLHTALLPGHIQAILPAHLQAGGRDVGLPLGNRAPGFQYYERLSLATSPQNYAPEQLSTSIALTLEELFVFRFACWFVFAPNMNTMIMAPVAGSDSSQSKSSQSGSRPPTSSSSGVVPQRRPSNILYLSARHTDDMVKKNPPLELLRRYFERLLPYDASSLTRWGHFFFETLTHLWFLRNVDLVAAAAAAAPTSNGQGLLGASQNSASLIVARPQYGGMTYTSASSLGAHLQYFVAPSHDLLKAMAIFFVYLSSAPGLRCGYPDSRRNNATPFGGDAGTLSSALVASNWDEGERRHGVNEYLLELGQTPYLRALRKPTYQFFVTNLQKIGKLPNAYAAGMLDVMDLWLAFLQPWRAASRLAPKPTKTQDGVRGAFSAVAQAVSVRSPTRRQDGGGSGGDANSSRNDTQGGRGQGGASSSGRQDDGQSGGVPSGSRSGSGVGPRSSGQGNGKGQAQGESTSARFEPQWMWFVVQNYLTYAHVLQIVFSRMQETSLSDNDRYMVERAFLNTGAFCDPVVCILRACEIIIEDEVLRSPERSLANELATSFPHLQAVLGKESLDANRLNAPRKAEAEDLVAVVECLELNRGSVYAILTQHFKEFDWRVEERAIPALLDSRPAVQVILDQIRFSGRKQGRADDMSARAGAALGWLAHALGGDTDGKSSMNQAERSRLAVSRMHSVFNVPRQKMQAGSARADLADPAYARTAALSAPASRLMLGSPRWLGEQVTCVYQRLTALGRLQMDSGRRVCGSQDMHYVGDPLVNPPPVCSYEVGWLVRLMFSVSVALNKLCGLDHPMYEMDDQAGHAWKQSRFRFNLRFVADARNLLLVALVGLLGNLAFVGFSVPFPYALALLVSPLAVLLGPEALGEHIALLVWPMAIALQVARQS
ncbi:Sphingomyelin phosphodiesterase 4 [Hondaea fermentalgiana]|uniref:Sphingomyelin phosphodiesterase 4 n=1 Tax=Hondaea fermentalgiana TaxID=2315210 RepID=A0A2R5GH94_9STRA|nr:Sphingomyelin phosphodiesterase 4 [Hondaea fermentalgiana]|eukprot:GBG27641.1 Sphingomyelin phosphodiesterase 4 [Hondaea fermentalgiana]